MAQLKRVKDLEPLRFTYFIESLAGMIKDLFQYYNTIREPLDFIIAKQIRDFKENEEKKFDDKTINFLKNTKLNEISYLVSDNDYDPTFSIQNTSTKETVEFSNRMATRGEFRAASLRNYLDALRANPDKENLSLYDLFLEYENQGEEVIKNSGYQMFKTLYELDLANEPGIQDFIRYILKLLHDMDAHPDFIPSNEFQAILKTAYQEYLIAPNNDANPGFTASDKFAEQLKTAYQKYLIVQGVIDKVLPNGELNHAQARKVYSDHEPLISQTPITDEQGNTVQINMLTYNTLSLHNVFQGFKWPSGWDEATDQTRLNNIVGRIKGIANCRQTNLICLQETTVDFCKKIKDALGEDWAILKNDGNRAVLYKKSVFNPPNTQKANPIDLPKGGNPANNDFCGGQLEVKSLNKKTISVFSVHAPHSEDPTAFQTALQEIGKEFADHTVLLGCDANRRVASLSAKLRDNANNLIPPGFRNEDTGNYDSTDVCMKIENNFIQQLPGQTPHPQAPIKNLLRRPQLNLARNENPYRAVINSLEHHLPIGQKGLNIKQFLKKLFDSNNVKESQESLESTIHVAPRTNEKALLLYTNKSIPVLEELGLSRQEGQGKNYYVLFFAYPNEIPADYIAPYDTDTEETFFLRVNGEVRRCSLDGSHQIRKEISKDVLVTSGILSGFAGGGAAIGALVGAVALPLVGAPVGAALGALLGTTAGLIVAGVQALARNRFVGGLNTKGETLAAGVSTTLGSLGLGALIGTLILPGFGSTIGALVGLGLGVIATISIDLIREKIELNSALNRKNAQADLCIVEESTDTMEKAFAAPAQDSTIRNPPLIDTNAKPVKSSDTAEANPIPMLIKKDSNNITGSYKESLRGVTLFNTESGNDNEIQSKASSTSS